MHDFQLAGWLPAIASVLLAIIPVIIWINILNRQGEEKSLYFKTFLLGTFAVVPPFLLILLFDRFPELNIYSIINSTVEQIALAVLFTNVFVGIIEEIAKHIIVRIIDKRHPEYIQTISSALKLSICAGLGFAFAENIFYFYSIWTNPNYSIYDLFSTYVFRSIFTMCGHMVFSGIFGYHFGIGKFAADITEEARWEGNKMRFTRFVSRITGKMPFQIVREEKNMLGLFLAMALHASFNALLDLQQKIPSILIVFIGAVYIAYLLHTKSGHLLFSLTKRKVSTMTPKDQDVVLELLGMWFKEGRLEEVIGICDRLLARDPDNNVVKLFRAKAGDNEKLRQVYKTLKDVFAKEKALKVDEKAGDQAVITMDKANEEIVIEVMDAWFKEKKYKEVLAIANRLLERNPASQGAKLLLQKALDREKLQRMFTALGTLFHE